jgi:hypothetical protein
MLKAMIDPDTSRRSKVQDYSDTGSSVLSLVCLILWSTSPEHDALFIEVGHAWGTTLDQHRPSLSPKLRSFPEYASLPKAIASAKA